VEALIGALEHADPSVRSAAASALGCLRDPRAAHPLVMCLRDRYSSVIQAAMQSLCQLGSSAVPDLLSCIVVPKERWGGAKFRSETAMILGQIKDPAALEPLLFGLMHDHASVQYAYVTALGLLGDGRAVRVLVDTLNWPLDADTRGAVIEANRDVSQRVVL